VFPAHAGM